MSPQSISARERLQRKLIDLGAPIERSGRRGSKRPAVARSAVPVPAGRKAAENGRRPEQMAEVVSRLDRIEHRLLEIAHPASGTPEKFRVWVAEGYWEHISFSEFLSLKRPEAT